MARSASVQMLVNQSAVNSSDREMIDSLMFLFNAEEITTDQAPIVGQSFIVISKQSTVHINVKGQNVVLLSRK